MGRTWTHPSLKLLFSGISIAGNFHFVLATSKSRLHTNMVWISKNAPFPLLGGLKRGLRNQLYCPVVVLQTAHDSMELVGRQEDLLLPLVTAGLKGFLQLALASQGVAAVAAHADLAVNSYGSQQIF